MQYDGSKRATEMDSLLVLAIAIHRLADVLERSMVAGLGGQGRAGHNPAPLRSPQATVGTVLTPSEGGDRGA